MTIKYRLDSEGGFTAGCIETNITAYAYPTSVSAEQAKRNPDAIASDMLARECFSYRGLPEFVIPYDARNWKRINGTR